MLRRYSSLSSLVAVTGLLAACSDGQGPSSANPEVPEKPQTPGNFESANPSGNSDLEGPRGPVGAPGSGGSANAGAPPSGNPSPTPITPGTPGTPDNGDGGAGRAIQEADIIKIEDGKLYALSRYGGLSVVDVSRRDRLALLGRHKIVATPFEMYVEDGVVFALYNGYGEYAFDESVNSWQYRQTSQVVALDARDPESIQVLGNFLIPGDISDSRTIGDILYVAAYENGSCWGCEQNTARTNLISLDVSSPAGISKVDELSIPERIGGYSWRRSLSATSERLYLAGPTWGNTEEPVGSTIQVVDISDPSGDLREGTSVQIAGQIQSRWQMDEYEGVLRVVSQPFTWRLDVAPTVQTFAVESSDELVALGSLQMKLPRPEQLQSVRFDGDRGYAVTFERTDPLFTLDLSDPARPRQVGELEMPGWLYHMEPRGDRLLGLGYDQGNQDGSITVSLFDVSDLATPTMLSRVNFGGDWGFLPEDQDRIHKAFNVLDASGLILVPFSGYSNPRTPSSIPGKECYISRYASGVQLVDWADDALTLRGVAPSKGAARRGFVHDERLFTVSDERVETFDVTDRDAPRTTASLPLAQFVNHTQGAGDNVVRIGQNWWTSTVELDVTSVAAASSPSALGRLEIPELNQQTCNSYAYLSGVYSSDTAAYLLYDSYQYDIGEQSSRLLTVDLSDPSAPRVESDTTLGSTTNYGIYIGGAVDTGSRAVTVGTTFVAANRTYEYTNAGRAVSRESELKVVDLSDPSAPHITVVPLARSFGATGLLTSGTLVLATQAEAVTEDFSRLRFYLERVDVADPRNPTRLPPVNIPGSLLSFDVESSNAVTVDYRNYTLNDLTARECYETIGGQFSLPPGADASSAMYQTTPGICRGVQHILRLVHIEDDRATILKSYELDPSQRVGSTAFGDDRVFISVGQGSYYVRGPIGLPGGPGFYGSFETGDLPILVVGGMRSGRLDVGSLTLETGDQWGGSGLLVASGTRAAFGTGFRGKLTVVDGADPQAPSVLRELELPGYVSDLDVVNGTVIASLSQDGVATLPLDD